MFTKVIKQFVAKMDLSSFSPNVVDNDKALAANSDERLVTQKAIKSYVDTKNEDKLNADNNLSDVQSKFSARQNLELESGNWTSTLAAYTNVKSFSGGAGIYLRQGNRVSCYLNFSITPNEVGIGTEIDFSLPLISNFTAVANLIGCGSASQPSFNISGRSHAISGSSSGRFVFISASLAAHNFSLSFGYTII